MSNCPNESQTTVQEVVGSLRMWVESIIKSINAGHIKINCDPGYPFEIVRLLHWCDRIERVSQKPSKMFIGPKLDVLPKLYVQVEQIREKRVRVRLVFGHVDATLPYPNPESKVYSDEEIRRIIGTFLVEKRLFSFEDDILTIAWGGEDHHLVIDIGHDIHSWGDKLPYYWYHTALSMAEILYDARDGIFGMVTEHIKPGGEVVGYRFQPCAVPGLVMRAQEHLDD